MKLIPNKEIKKEIEIIFQDGKEYELVSHYLRVQQRQYRFKKIKNGKWSGYVDFLRKHRFVPIQLWHFLYMISQKHNLPFDISEVKHLLINKVNEEKLKEIYEAVIEIDPKLKYDADQFDAILGLAKHRYVKSNLSVAYGKTATLFVVIAYLIMEHDEKILIINPKPSLNIQMYAEFFKWCSHEKLIPIRNRIIATATGVSFDTYDTFSCVISNFQYLMDKEGEFLENTTTAVIDEVHRASSKSYKNILSRCKNIISTKGVSGSIINDGTVESMSVLIASGFTLKTVKKREIIESGRATDGKIILIKMNTLSPLQVANLSDFYLNNKDGLERQRKEADIVRGSATKITHIVNFAVGGLTKHDGNGLIFFRDVKNRYGRKIFEEISFNYPKIKVFYIDEKVPERTRSEIYAYARNNKNVLIVVSYDIASTGLDIPTLTFGVMAEAIKSPIVLSQVIGRFMRKNEGKTLFALYDIVDFFLLRDGSQSYGIRWFKNSREKIYAEDKFKIEEVNININHNDWL